MALDPVCRPNFDGAHRVAGVIVARGERLGEIVGCQGTGVRARLRDVAYHHRD